MDIHTGKLIPSRDVSGSRIHSTFVFLHCAKIVPSPFEALELATSLKYFTFPIQHIMIELDGFKLLAALKHLMAA